MTKERSSGSTEGPPDYLCEPLGAFLEELAARAPAPSGGAAAALAVAFAAALVGMVAGLSHRELEDADELVGRGGELRARAGRLAGEDVAAYGEVLRARGEARRDALSRAADVPLEVAEIGAEVAEMAARVVAGGKPTLRGDAVTAVSLAEAGARAAAELVIINLGDAGRDDERTARAAAAAATANAARRAAL